MEVRPGYKQTEVGVIPEEWEVARISSLLASPIQNGVFNEPSRKGRGCKLINVVDLYGRFPLETEALERFAANRDELSRFAVRNGDMFFTRSSLTADGIAQCNIYQGDDEDLIVFDCHIIRVRPNKTRVEPSFLARLCGSDAARRYLVVNAKTTTMTTIDQSVIARLPVAVPPLPEQRAIATALSDVDALLGGLDRLIAKKRDLKQAAMQQLLTGQTRLPGFHGEWPMSTVGNEFEIQLGKMLDAARNTGTPKPYVGNKAVQWGRVELDDVQTVPMSRADLERYRLAAGDLLVCEGGEVGRAAIWEASISECYFQKALHRLRPTNGFDVRFMLALLRHWVGQGLLENYVTQTSIAHLTREKFAQIPLPVPTREEQEAIAITLSAMDAELSALEARRKKTRDLKQAMMQELLTGRTRLV